MTDARCAFDSNNCSESLEHASSLDQHHEWPKHLGGDPNQETMLSLCPNHHRRQHAVIRYLIECHEAGMEAAWDVLCHFTKPERDTAMYAVSKWAADPTAPHPVNYWTSDAAH